MLDQRKLTHYLDIDDPGPSRRAVVNSPEPIGEFMATSDQQMDERARLTSEFEECGRVVASTEAELRRIGAAFVELGNQLQTAPSRLSTQRLIIEKDLAELWLILPEYLEALEEREAKRAALQSLK